MNTPVSFELAKLLKEKGFDKECFDAYNLHGMKFSNGWLEYLSDNNIEIPFSNKALKHHDVLAPTIADVVMWLYEKHGIWVQVTVNTIWVGRNKEPQAKYNSETVSKNRNLKVRSLITTKVSMEPFDSPTEAYEAAILHCLNNLIT